MPDFSPPTSCLPSLRAVLLPAPLTAQKRPRYYEGSDSRRPHPERRVSLRLFRLVFPPFRPQPRDPSGGRFISRLSVIGRSRLRRYPAGSPRAHADQVRTPTDWRFASSCSPPRFAATQLPSATKLRHTLTGTCTLLTKRPHGRTGGPAQGRALMLKVAKTSETATDFVSPDSRATRGRGSARRGSMCVGLIIRRYSISPEGALPLPLVGRG